MMQPEPDRKYSGNSGAPWYDGNQQVSIIIIIIALDIESFSVSSRESNFQDD